MNKFEQLFNELSKVDDPTFLWLNWMDWVIDANLIAVHNRNLDFHGHEQEYYKLYLAWVEIVNNHLQSTDDYYYDYLGEYFEEYLISHFHKKNDNIFFTPSCVSKAMTLLTDIPVDDGKFVYDCACGSGRLLLDAHEQNPNNIMIGWDYNKTASRMAVLNFYIHGIRGSIIRKNTLTDEYFEAWRVNNYLGYGLPVPHIELCNESTAYHFIGLSKDTTESIVSKSLTTNSKVTSQPTLEAWL